MHGDPSLQERLTVEPAGGHHYSQTMNNIFPLGFAALLAVSACSQDQVPAFLRPGEKPPAGSSAPLDPTRQVQPGSADLSDEVRAVVSAPTPPSAARTAEEFDTTTSDQRTAAKAAAAADGGEIRLGETVASLGDPTKSGFWIKSPLVTKAGQGRIEYPATGKSALVELIPLVGPASGGSQVSLAALRLVEAPITDLPTLVIYAR